MMFMAHLLREELCFIHYSLPSEYTVLGPRKELSKYFWNERMNKCMDEPINVRKNMVKIEIWGEFLHQIGFINLKQSTIIQLK